MKNRLKNERKAKEIILKSKSKNNFKGSLETRSTSQRPCFSGEIRRLRDIRIDYNPSYPLHETPYKDSFSLTLQAVVEHEITHKFEFNGRGCPKNETLDLNNILIPISGVLKNKGFPNIIFGNQGHTFYTYFANLFEDFIVNNIVSDNNGSKGIFLLYEDMAYHSGKFNDLFEGFTKLQAMTFPKKQGVSLLLDYFNQSDKAKNAVQNYLKRTGLRNLPKEKKVNLLANPENWKNLSTIFAEEFSELVDLEDIASSYFLVFGGNDFSRLNDEETQMELAIKAYGRSGSEFEPPVFLEDNLALLSLYKRLAKDIKIKVKSHSVETEMPIAHVSKRRFNFREDSVEDLIFGIDRNGKIEAQTGNYPLVVKSRYQVSPKGFPEIRVGLLDCSSSTQREINGKGKVMNPWATENMQWTDKSIYHHELSSFFGLCELFRRRGALKSSNVKLGVFSNNTRMAKNLTDSEKYALQPCFGGTRFDKDSLEEIFQGRDSLVYTISDGEIGNWVLLKDYFIKGAKRHNYFHLQIGGETEMYKDIKSAGLKAILDDGQNSAEILIDLTQKEIYSQQKQQK